MIFETNEILKKIYENGYISRLGYYNAQFISKISENIDNCSKELIQLTSALLSYYLDKGHTCIDLRDFEGKEFKLLEENLSNSDICSGYKFPSRNEWLNILKKSNILGFFNEDKPLVMDKKERVFYQKFYKYERELAENLLNKAKDIKDFDDKTLKKIKKALCLLVDKSTENIDHQKLAAEVALLKKLCIISGGAGTGKTYTASMILSLLLVENPSYKIALAAPTGKAANRLLESVKKYYQTFKNKLQGLLENPMPDKCFTIHRLLRASDSRLGFYHNEERTLPYDVLIVDEVSMMDLALMVHLFRALKKGSKIILLGDKNQLTSVEAGSVLGEICSIGKMNDFSLSMAGRLGLLEISDLSQYVNEDANLLQDCMVELIENKRQKENSSIDVLAQFVNEGKSSEALNLIQNSRDIEYIPFTSINNIPDKIVDLIKQHYIPLLKIDMLENKNFENTVSNKTNYEVNRIIGDDFLDRAFESFNKFRILTPYRRGLFSVEFMNKFIESLFTNMTIMNPYVLWYSGKPLLIHKNDYNLHLFNGDVGLIFKDKEALSVYFEKRSDRPVENDEYQNFRKIHPSLLPEYETAYTMTIHKSQGSEYEEVLIVFGNRDSQLLSRQLLYTAITRTKKKLYLYGEKKLIKKAIENPIKRYSALGDYLKTHET